MLTKEQLEARITKVMASGAAALAGLHPYQSVFDGWAAAMGTADVEYNDAMRMGDALEAGLRNVACELLEWPAVDLPGTIFHPDEPWAGCTPDGLSVGMEPAAGLQIKVSGLHMAKDYQGKPGDGGEWDNNLIPLYHLIQCTWEMYVTGRRLWYLAVYFGGADFRLYRLIYNEELADALVNRLRDVWARHLDPNGPQEEPDLDGSEAAAAHLKRKFPVNKDDLIPPSDDHWALADEYAALTSRKKELETALETVKQKLMEAVGHRDGLEGICTWKRTNPKPKVNWEGLAKALFDAYKSATMDDQGLYNNDFEDFAADHTTQPEGSRVFRFNYKP